MDIFRRAVSNMLGACCSGQSITAKSLCRQQYVYVFNTMQLIFGMRYRNPAVEQTLVASSAYSSVSVYFSLTVRGKGNHKTTLASYGAS